MKNSNEHVSFAKNRVFLTLFAHLFFGTVTSFIPEINIGFWLKLNISLAILMAITNYIIWIYHKDNSKRYFSLHSFVMFIGYIFYLMSPVFKGLYPTVYFWLLLLLTVGLAVFLLIKYKVVTKLIVNPQHYLFSSLLMLYVGILMLVGGIFWAYMRVFEPLSWVPIGIIFYFIALFFVLIAPVMLATPEQVKEFKKIGNNR
ncbi:hypothetical protein [Solibacillus sp. CAU 1738]|uniref:hypothetical protein n=1 Tax=Solibacillus sp. CAU 1738 TaxID=3140363 RepID=UPI003260153D